MKGKQKVRKAKTIAGNLMLKWRKLRDEGNMMHSVVGSLR